MNPTDDPDLAAWCRGQRVRDAAAESEKNGFYTVIAARRRGATVELLVERRGPLRGDPLARVLTTDLVHPLPYWSESLDALDLPLYRHRAVTVDERQRGWIALSAENNTGLKTGVEYSVDTIDTRSGAYPDRPCARLRGPDGRLWVAPCATLLRRDPAPEWPPDPLPCGGYRRILKIHDL